MLYDPNSNVFKEDKLADTTAFNYKFEYWTPMNGRAILAQPDTIYTTSYLTGNPKFRMIYSLWGIPQGHYRVVLEPTGSLPTNIKLMLSTPNNDFHVIEGRSALDTINAYCKTSLEAMNREEFTLAISYADSVFLINSNCIPGWALRYHINAAQFDTTNALKALDSLLYVIDNDLDTFYPDTSKVTDYNKWWLNDYKTGYEFKKWKMRNPNVSKWVKFF